MKGHATRLLVSAMAVALVTGAVFALKTVAPVLSLGVLYIFACCTTSARSTCSACCCSSRG